jgi:membrane associated rhomboid family serine protease
MPLFTYSVIIITVISSLIAFSNEPLFKRGLFSTKSIIKDKEYYRLITSQLLHVNLVHLGFNMFSFYSFAETLELTFGLKLTAAVYLYSALGGDMLALLIRRKEPDYTAVGASGAVSGIIFSSVFLLPDIKIFMFLIPVPLPSWLFAVLFMGISLYGIGKGTSRIGHEAHLGGALAGIVWALLYNPEIINDRPLLLFSLTVPVILLIIIFIKKPGFVKTMTGQD